jgi:FOG: WD40 repeat
MPREKNMPQYEAFISYRHIERDQQVAKALMGQLERYRIPKALQQKLGRKKLNKLFRDREELPICLDLERGIKDAIEASRFLIVIASPTLKDSPWCMKEIEYFIECHGREHLLVVLSQGEPSESFPPILLENGAEPLAADVRAKTTFGATMKLRREKLRLIAQMLNVSFDDLFRRYQRRRLRLIAASATLVAAVSAGFAGMTLYQSAQIEKQRVIAVENEIGLLSGRALIATGENNRLLGAEYALNAYERYVALYPKGQAELEKQVAASLEAAAYTQGFEVLSAVSNGGRRLGSLQYSPDDRYLLAIIGGNSAALIDAESLNILYTVTDGTQSLDSVAFSPDGRYFLTASHWDNHVSVWRTNETREKVAEIKVENGLSLNITGAQFISDTEILLDLPRGFESDGPTLAVWDFKTDGKRILAGAEDLKFTALSEATTLSADGRLAAPIVELMNAFYVLDTVTGEKFSLPSDIKAYRHWAFSFDGTRLAGVCYNEIAVWDLLSRELVFSLPLEDGLSKAVLFSPDGTQLAAGTQVLDAKTGAPLFEMHLPETHIVLNCLFSPDGLYLAAVTDKIAVFNTQTGLLQTNLEGAAVTSCAFRHDGRRLITNTLQGTADLYGTPETATAVMVQSYAEDLYRRDSFTPNAEYALTVSTHHLSSFQSPMYIEQLYSDSSGRFVAMPLADGFIEMWDLKKGADPIAGINEHGAIVSDMAFTADKMLSIGYDGRFMVYDMTSAQVRYVLTLADAPLKQLETDARGELAMVLTQTGSEAIVLNIETGRILYRLKAEPATFFADIGFSMDSENAVAIQADGKAIVGALYQTLDKLKDSAQNLLH